MKLYYIFIGLKFNLSRHKSISLHPLHFAGDANVPIFPLRPVIQWSIQIDFDYITRCTFNLSNTLPHKQECCKPHNYRLKFKPEEMRLSRKSYSFPNGAYKITFKKTN